MTEDNKSSEVMAALIAYIDHVGSCEGVDFLSRSEEAFTPGQWAILMRARAEVDKQYEQKRGALANNECHPG